MACASHAIAIIASPWDDLDRMLGCSLARGACRRVGLPPAELILFSGFFAIAGLLGIAFNGFLFDKPGHCNTCGYNLTGNVSGICSECGAKVLAP